jgi:predicted NBD/HSP70 family sugar kinase
VAALTDFGAALAEGAAAMVLAVDPQLLVIGGPNAAQAELFLEPFTRRLAELCPLVPEVRVSTLGQDAVLQGTLTLAVDALRRGLWNAIETRNSFPEATPSLGEVKLSR